MLWPVTPASVSMSVSTRGDAATTPPAVRCGSAIGTLTARTRIARTVGEEVRCITISPGLTARTFVAGGGTVPSITLTRGDRVDLCGHYGRSADPHVRLRA